MNVSPGSFIDISTNELNLEKRSIINNNISLFKRLGRVSNVHNRKINKNGIKIIVGVETITLYLDQNFNLLDQRLKYLKKLKIWIKKLLK